MWGLSAEESLKKQVNEPEWWQGHISEPYLILEILSKGG